MKILPDIYLIRTPVPRGYSVRHVNAYLLVSNNGSLLVDTGWSTDEAFESLTSQIGETGLPLADLATIVVTHVHVDHHGLAGRLAEHSPARLIAHEAEAALLESRVADVARLRERVDVWLSANGLPDEDRQMLVRIVGSTVERERVRVPEATVRGGERLRVGDFELEVIWTPGHSPGHICLYERTRRILLSGDHVLPRVSPIVGLETPAMRNPLGDYLQSLQALRQLPVELVLPAHGDPFRNLPQRIDEITSHMEQRGEHILTAVRDGAQTAYEIAAAIPWTRKGLRLADLAPVSKRGAIVTTLAHLERLRACGALRRSLENGVYRYALGERQREPICVQPA